MSFDCSVMICCRAAAPEDCSTHHPLKIGTRASEFLTLGLPSYNLISNARVQSQSRVDMCSKAGGDADNLQLHLCNPQQAQVLIAHTGDQLEVFSAHHCLIHLVRRCNPTQIWPTKRGSVANSQAAWQRSTATNKWSWKRRRNLWIWDWNW